MKSIQKGIDVFIQQSSSSWSFFNLPRLAISAIRFLAAGSPIGKVTWRYILAEGKFSVFLPFDNLPYTQWLADPYWEHNNKFVQINTTIRLKNIDILRNYRRPILMTDSNPVHSGNNSSKSSMSFRVY